MKKKEKIGKAALDVPERYIDDESAVSALNQYAQIIHSIVGHNTSLGVTLKNGMKVLLFDDPWHQIGETTVVMDFKFGGKDRGNFMSWGPSHYKMIMIWEKRPNFVE
uniref:Uncharacterized protein n=1 Tax=Romanomermis culicivorax TaxID=13658 RepID=A0A915K364_ROMCU